MSIDSPPSKNQLRLGYLVSQYPALSHSFVLREIRAIRQLGFDIRVVSVRKPDREPEALSLEEAEELRETFCILGSGWLRVLAANCRTFVKRPLRYLTSLASAVRLAGFDVRKAFFHMLYFAEAVVAGEYFSRAGMTLVHCHFSSTVAMMMADVFPGLKFSLTIHGSDEFYDAPGTLLAEKVARAAFIIAISRFTASQIMRCSDSRFWGKIHVLPLGVNVASFPARDLDEAVPRATFRILSVGRLVSAKAYQLLVTAVARLIAEGRTNLSLTIIGEGPERSSLEEIIASENLQHRVHLPGPRNYDDVLEYYKQADVFALSSVAEGVPVVLMEAMAMGIPCVAPMITGIPELIRNDVDGLLVTPADPDAIADAISRLMDDPGLRARLSQSARMRVADRYNLPANTELLAGTFRAYLTNQRSAGRISTVAAL
jgi:colanic acid/amylovoran biosynthesis glycosyltransferase